MGVKPNVKKCYTLFNEGFPNITLPCFVLPKWSPALSTILGIMVMGMLKMLNIQPA